MKLLGKNSAFSGFVKDVRQEMSTITRNKDFRVFRPNVGMSTSKFGLADRQGDINEMYKAYKSLAYACISARAKAVANAGRLGKFKVYKEVSNEDTYKKIPTSHPLVQILRNPNPWMSRWTMWYLTSAFLDATGNSYWWIAKDKTNTPRELWLIPSDVVRIIPGDPSKGEDIIVAYELVWSNGERIVIPAADIVHFKHPSLTSTYYYGDSLIMKAAVELDLDEFISLHQREFFKNDAMPGVVVTFPTFLKKEWREEFETRWINKFKGKPGQAGFIEGGATIQTLVNQRELDYLQTRGINTKRVQAVFGVPDSKLMLSENITARATLETIEYNFSKETIEPLLTMLDEQLTMDFAHVYWNTDLVIIHDSTIPKDLKAQAELDKEYFGIGVRSINEIRKRDGLEPIEGGDEHYIPFNAVPLAQSGNNPGAAGGQTPSEPAKALKDPVIRIVKYLAELDEGHKKSYWDQLEAKRLQQERLFTPKIKAFYRDVEADVLTNIHRKDVSASLMFDKNEFHKKLVKIYGENMAGMIQAGFDEFIALYSVDGLLFAPNSPEVVRAIELITEKSVSVTDTLYADLKAQLDEGIRLHESVSELAARVGTFFNNVVDYRSMRIARTTSTYAVNTGLNMAAKNSGLFTMKMWISQRDLRVRDTHAPNTGVDGQKVKIDEKYTLPDGDKLSMPGDPEGKPENTINCRCVQFFTKD